MGLAVAERACGGGGGCAVMERKPNPPPAMGSKSYLAGVLDNTRCICRDMPSGISEQKTKSKTAASKTLECSKEKGGLYQAVRSGSS